MTDAFVTVLVGVLVSTCIMCLVRAKYPGLRTLCHWTWLASSLLAVAATLIGLHNAMEFRAAGVLSADIIIMIQLAVWILLMEWLPDGHGEKIYNEHGVLRAMTALTDAMARVVATTGGEE